MNQPQNSQIDALVRLLDDNDESIYEQISEQLYEIGRPAISALQTSFDDSEDELLRERLALILDDLKLEQLKLDLEDWLENHSDDLLEGCLRIAKFGYPNLDETEIRDLIANMVEDIKVKMPQDDAYDTIDAMNETILNEYGFKGNVQNYSHVQNSFINLAAKNRVGNPIMLSVFYILTAQELDIPIVGINSPAHFLIAYAKSNIDWKSASSNDMVDHIQFYADPFYNGRTYDHGMFDNILRSAKYKVTERIRLIASNEAIIRRIMNNLIYGLHVSGEEATAKNLLELVESL